MLKSLADGAWTTRIAEPKGKGLSRWHGDDAARRAVYNNRNRLLSGVAKAAFKLRAEVVERGFAQVLDRGGMRRTWLRGRENISKRYLIHVAGHNLGVLLRQLIGAGTPREAAAKGLAVLLLVLRQEQSLIIILALNNPPAPGLAAAIVITPDASSTQSSSTGC